MLAEYSCWGTKLVMIKCLSLSFVIPDLVLSFTKKDCLTLLYKQQIKTEYTFASELLYVMNQLQVGNSTYEDEYLLSTHLDYIFMEIITYTLNVLEKLCQQNSLHSSFTFWSSKFESTSRSNWTGIWTGNSNGSWTDKHSSYFSTAKEMSVKATFFFVVKTTANKFWNDAEMLLKSFWTSHLQMMKGLEPPILELNW